MTKVLISTFLGLIIGAVIGAFPGAYAVVKRGHLIPANQPAPIPQQKSFYSEKKEHQPSSPPLNLKEKKPAVEPGSDKKNAMNSTEKKSEAKPNQSMEPRQQPTADGERGQVKSIPFSARKEPNNEMGVLIEAYIVDPLIMLMYLGLLFGGCAGAIAGAVIGSTRYLSDIILQGPQARR